MKYFSIKNHKYSSHDGIMTPLRPNTLCLPCVYLVFILFFPLCFPASALAHLGAPPGLRGELQVEEVVVEENAAVGTVVEQVFPGLRTKTGTVRQAKVRVGAAKPTEQEVQAQDRAAVNSSDDEDGAL